MKPPPPPPLLALLLLSLFLLNPPSTSSATTPSSAASPATSPTSSPTSNSSSTLDPKQVRALQSLGIPTLKNPCSNPSLTDVVVCDKSSPFRHITSLKLKKCADDISVTTTALKSLSTLQDLQFIDCPVAAPSRFPQELTSNLHSFTCIDSLGKLTGVMLGKMQNLTDLTVTGVPIIASGPVIILGNLKNLKSATISNTNLTGYLPKHWRTGITHLDLSNNNLKGKIPTTITTLEKLSALDLSSNNLSGEIPSSIGDLLELKNLSLSSNKLSGSIPDTLSAIPSLIYLNLSSNQLNGTIPSFIGKMKRLKYLNLESNNFAGVMPFTASFIEKLEVFKISENSNLCYNHSSISSKMKLGIAKCDKDGNPVSPPAEKADSPDSSDYDYNSEDASSEKSSGGEHHGPNKVVLGVAIGLSSIVFLIIFLILLSKWCA